MAIEKYLAVGFSALSAVAGGIWWAVKKIRRHDEDIAELKQDVKKIEESNILQTLAQHEIRIKMLEGTNENFNTKLDNLVSGVSEIKGILVSKKDKV